jgi:hypothetical protein
MTCSNHLHPAWDVFLQHPLLSTQQQLVCQLLCLSTSMRTALHAAAAGQIICRVSTSEESNDGNDDTWSAQGATPVLLASTAPALLASPAPIESFGLWLAQHAALLHTLDLGYQQAGTEAPFALSNAAGQALAAAGPPGLLLQGYRGCWDANILQQLPAATLTYLSITEADDLAEEMEVAFGRLERLGHPAHTPQALIEPLVNLRHLGIVEHAAGLEVNVNGLLPALQGMTQLTYLEMGLSRGVEHYLHHLPASLLELRVGATTGRYCLLTEQEGETMEEWNARYPAPMDLGHLTALTKLLLGRDTCFEVQSGDVLPPMVQEMEAPEVIAWDPLLKLRSLHLLRTRSLPAGVAARMTKLASLQALFAEHAAVGREELVAYAKLPLLELSSTHIAAAAVPELAGLTRVTHLDIIFDRSGLIDDHVARLTTLQHLTSALQHLTRLVVLCVHERGSGLPGGRHLEASLGFAITVGGLPALRSLQLSSIPLSKDAAHALAAASSLTSLALRDAQLQDYHAIVLAMHLPHLQHLDIVSNADVSDAVMAVVGKQLLELRSCHVWHTGVTASTAGLRWLLPLQHLQKVHVCRDHVAAAAAILGQDKVEESCWCQ